MLLAAVAGGVVAPELVDQAVGGDDLVRVQQQDRQQRALLDPAERERAIVLGHLERAKEPEFHLGHLPGRRDRTTAPAAPPPL